MPERLRTIVNGLRRFVGERRRALRHQVRLRASVSLAEHSAQKLSGHTRDLSATGLALILPAIRIGERYLMGEGKQIVVALELPSNSVVIRAMPVRYERLEEEAGEAGYLVGAHINEMSETDRSLFVEYLRGLK